MGVSIEAIRNRVNTSENIERDSEAFLLIDLGGERIWSRFGLAIVLPRVPKLPYVNLGPAIWADVSHDTDLSAFDATRGERPPTEPKPRRSNLH